MKKAKSEKSRKKPFHIFYFLTLHLSNLRVSLFITCLVDQLAPQVGVSTVEVLRRVGCEVVFDERQTCCGQPAFNTGYRSEAQKFAKRFIEIFEEADSEAIVSPSGSWTGVVKHFY